MKIRAYQDSDTDEILSLWSQCGLINPQNDPVKDIQRKLLVNPDLFLVGSNERGLLATVMGGYEGHRGWINYLAVQPSERRKGYGQQIMVAVELRLKDKGCPKINLQIRDSNAAVAAFYRALGYGDDNVLSLGKRLEPDL